MDRALLSRAIKNMQAHASYAPLAVWFILLIGCTHTETLSPPHADTTSPELLSDLPIAGRFFVPDDVEPKLSKPVPVLGDLPIAGRFFRPE